MAAVDPTSRPPVRLLIVDADRRVRESLTALATCESVQVVGDTGQPGRAVELVETYAPDVVIVDPKLPEIDNGLALIRTIKERSPSTAILAMGWSDELEASCVAAGADGFVSKSDAPNDFVDAIVAAGQARAGAGRGAGGVVRPEVDAAISDGDPVSAGRSRRERRSTVGGASAPVGPILNHATGSPALASPEIIPGQAVVPLAPSLIQPPSSPE